VRGSPGRNRLIRKDEALQDAEKLIGSTKIGSFVTGHDFSRADMLQNEHWALAPANYHGTKRPNLGVFQQPVQPVHPIQQ
jgi:hypothetical protein